MKNVIRSVCIAFATILMVWSCKKDDSAAFPPEDEPVAVQFGSNIGGVVSLARPSGIRPAAAGSAWEGNDAIGVFMVDNGGANVRNETTNKRYVTAAGNGDFAPDGESNTVYYPINGDKVDFIAYYPYTSAITTLGAYDVDVSDQSAPAAIDLLYAKATNGGSGYGKTNTSPVALTFGHQLSKLTLNISAPVGSTQITPADLTSMTVRIAGLNTRAQFNLAAGTLGAASDAANITPFAVTAGAKYEAILLPGSFSGVSVTFTITAGNNPGVYVWNVPDGAFETGKEYVYSVSFTGALGDVSVTGVINPWELGGTPTSSVITHNAPEVNETLSANKPYQFEWATIPNVTAYSLKFAASAAELATTPISFEAGNSGNYIVPAATLKAFLATAGVPVGGTTKVPVYWTVVPTNPAQYSGVGVQVSMFKSQCGMWDACESLTGWGTGNGMTLSLDAADPPEGYCIKASGKASTIFVKTFPAPFDTEVSRADGYIAFSLYVKDATALGAPRPDWKQCTLTFTSNGGTGTNNQLRLLFSPLSPPFDNNPSSFFVYTLVSGWNDIEVKLTDCLPSDNNTEADLSALNYLILNCGTMTKETDIKIDNIRFYEK